MPQVRIGVSLDEDVLRELDELVQAQHFPNRSQAIRHLVVNRLVDTGWDKNETVSGAIILLYDHHKSDVLNKINLTQHDYLEEILSSQHFHLDHKNCLEIIALKGKAKKLAELGKKLIGLKGVMHGKLVTSKLGY